MFKGNINEWKTTRTFATQANLEKALVKLGLDKVGCIIMVASPIDGRLTAIFGKSFLDAANVPVFYPAHEGFKVVG